MFVLLSLLVSAAAVMAAVASNSTVIGPDPTEVYIQSFAYGGSGCPQGSVGGYLSTDRQTITFLYDTNYFQASIGPNVPATQNRKNCQLNLNLHYPQGWQYSVLSTTFRGAATLDPNISGYQKATYYFSGQSEQASAQANIKGPVKGNYLVTTDIGFSSRIQSPCGTSLPLNINSEVDLFGGGNGVISEDSTDGHIKFVAGFQWRKC